MWGKRSTEFALSVNHNSGGKATSQRMWQKKNFFKDSVVKIEDFIE